MDFTKIKEYWDVLYNWGRDKILIILVVLVMLVLFLLFKSSTSLIFIKPQPGQKVRLELYDMCTDTVSAEDLALLPDSTSDVKYKPKLIKGIIIHCDFTREGMFPKKPWYINEFKIKYPGYNMVGYHQVVSNGYIIELKKLNNDKYLQQNEIVWGATGYNSNYIHIAYSGGAEKYTKNGKLINKDTRTIYQDTTLKNIVNYWKTIIPNLEVLPHSQVNTKGKTCPNFKVNY